MIKLKETLIETGRNQPVWRTVPRFCSVSRFLAILPSRTTRSLLEPLKCTHPNSANLPHFTIFNQKDTQNSMLMSCRWHLTIKLIVQPNGLLEVLKYFTIESKIFFSIFPFGIIHIVRTQQSERGGLLNACSLNTYQWLDFAFMGSPKRPKTLGT